MKPSRILYFFVGVFVVSNLWRYVALAVDRGSPVWYSAEAIRLSLWAIAGVAAIRYIARLESRLANMQKKIDTTAGKLSKIEGLVTSERRGLRDGFIANVLADIKHLDDGEVTLLDE